MDRMKAKDSVEVRKKFKFILVASLSLVILLLSVVIEMPTKRTEVDDQVIDNVREIDLSGVEPGIYDLGLEVEDNPIKSIAFSQLEIEDEVLELRIDDVPETGEHSKFIEVYAIDPTNLNFLSANITVVAKGTQLLKCKDWNYVEQTCEGEWKKLMDITPGKEYVLEISADDPGFAEINVTEVEHLDENKTFISDIFEEVEIQDGVWAEPIYHNEYIRATFEQNLTNGNVINLYVRNIEDSKTFIEIYEKDGSVILGSTPAITETAQYDIELSGMDGNNPVFDIKIVNLKNKTNAYLEFDYVHDAAGINSIQDDPDPLVAGSLISIQANVTGDISYVWIEIDGINYTMGQNNYLTSAMHPSGNPVEVTEVYVKDEIYKLMDMKDDNKRFLLNFSRDLVDNDVLNVYAKKDKGVAVGIYAQSDPTGTNLLGAFTVTSATGEWYNVNLSISTPTNAIWFGEGTDSGKDPKDNFDYIFASSSSDWWSHNHDTINMTVGIHNYTVYANDTSGNPASPITGNFTIIDVTPLVISNVNATPITASSATIVWDTDDNSNSTVDYGTTLSLGNISSDSSLTTSHSVALNNLNPNTIYYYNVTSCNSGGYCSTSGSYNFTTLFDIIPPAPITNLNNQSSGTTWIYWNWTNPADADFNETIIYLGGSNVANTSNNYYNATGLSSGTDYTITVHTKDDLGNVNDTDVNSTASTAEGITTNLVSPANDSTVFTDTISFVYNVSDPNYNISYCTLVLDEDDFETDQNITEDINQTFVIEDIPEGNHNWSVYCENAVGFIETSVTYIFDLVLDTDPPDIQDVNDTPDPVEVGYIINITANVTDDIAVDTVLVQIDGTNYTALNSSDIYYYEFTPTATGAFNYTIIANDTSSNTVAVSGVSPEFMLEDFDDMTDIDELSSPNNGEITQETTVKVQGAGSMKTDLFFAGDKDDEIYSVKKDLRKEDFRQFETMKISANGTGSGVQMVLKIITKKTHTFDPVVLAAGFNEYSFNLSEVNKLKGVRKLVIEFRENNANVDETVYIDYLHLEATQVDFDFTVQDTIAPFVSSVAPFNQTFNLNSTVEISANVMDYGTIDNVFANITWDSTSDLLELIHDSGDLYKANFTDTTWLGRYNITIIASDSFSNINSSENSYFLVEDAVSPDINSVNVTPNPVVEGGTVSFSSNVTDDDAVDSVLLEIDGSNNSMIYNATSLLWEYNWNATTPGLYPYTVYANDTQGYWATPVSGNLTVESAGPPGIISWILPDRDAAHQYQNYVDVKEASSMITFIENEGDGVTEVSVE